MANIEKDPKLLDKDTQEALVIFEHVCNKELNLNIKVTETYRTLQRQEELYAQGRKTAGKIVTECDGVIIKSIHQTRRAFDICYNVRGQEYNKDVLAKAGKVGISMGLEWGGSWGWDSPHFQLPVGKKAKDIRKHKEVDRLHNSNVDLLIKKGYKLNTESWYDDKINLNNVPFLLANLGGIQALVKRGVISDDSMWKKRTYKLHHVKSLIEKAAIIL